MNARDRINKAAFNLMNGTRDAVSAAVMKSVTDGKLQIERDQLQQLLMIISGTIESMYHTGIRVFLRSVDVALKEEKAMSEKK